MPYKKSMETKFRQVQKIVKDGLVKLKAEAQGGRSILLVYPPSEEEKYLNEIREWFDEKNYEFLNIAHLFVQQVDNLDGIDALVEETKFLREVPEDYFCEPFVQLIRKKIASVAESGKVPILERVGALVGLVTLNRVIEDNQILRLPKPLIVLYPGLFREQSGELFFLNEHRPASSYRAKIV